MKNLWMAVLLLSSWAVAEEAKSEDRVFHNESELGVVLATGNTKSQAYSAKQLNSYEIDRNVFKFRGSYLGTRSQGNETGRYVTLGLRYERAFTDAFSVFAAELFESDIFVGYNRRFNSDAGAKYFLLKTKDTQWFGELGYRHIAENQVGGMNVSSSNVRAYSEIVHQLNQSLAGKLWLEGIRNFSDSEDYRFSGEASISVILTSVLSLKTGYLVRYQNVPSKFGAERLDTLLTSALVAKF